MQDDNFYQTTRGQRALQNLGAIDPEDAQQAVASRLPAFHDVRKTEYLVLRSVGFSHAEALQTTEVEPQIYEVWEQRDEDFKYWASTNLRDLQKNLADDILRSRFNRNVFLLLHIDHKLLHDRAFNPDAMTPEDRKDAAEAAKRYTAPNIAAMMKVLGEGGDDGVPTGQKGVTVKVTVEGSEIVSVEAKIAASEALLKQFTVHESEALDGEYEVVE